VIDETPDTLTVAELIEILTGLLSRTDDPALKAQLLGLISTAAQVDPRISPGRKGGDRCHASMSKLISRAIRYC
jgi:hypothetical protein